MSNSSIGRPVWYHPAPDDPVAKRSDQPLAGFVVHYNEDQSVNLVVFDPVGDHFPVRDAQLYDGQGEKPEHGFAEWHDESASHRPEKQEDKAALKSSEDVKVKAPKSWKGKSEFESA